MIQPNDGLIELIPDRFQGETLLHFVNAYLELGWIKIPRRKGLLRKNRQLFVGEFGEAAKHDKSLAGVPGHDRQNPRAEQRDDRCVTGQHAKIAFDARQIDLLNLVCE